MNLLEGIARRVLLGDGAMGTELQRAGLEIGDCGERWNLDHPERIEGIHRAYREVGSQLVLTNSFGANPWVLGRYGLADRLEEINHAAARIARRAAGTEGAVLGDVGPSGCLLAPLGDLDVATLKTAITRQAAALLEEGVDGVIIETMTAIEEAVAAVEAARQAGARLVIVSMAFDRVANGRIRTMMGVAPEVAARTLSDVGADVIGANCGTHLAVADFAEIVRLLRSATDRFIMIQPNAGQPVLEGERAVYSLSPQEFAAGMRSVIEAGAAIVGGCCGTTPAHIGALRRSLDSNA